MIERTYLDVDGVINSLNSLDGLHWPVPTELLWVYEANGFDLYVPHYMAALIQAIDAQTEIVWCTTWEENANEWISPIMEIPERRVLLPDPADESLNWKEASVLVDMVTNPCAGAIWIEDHGYALDERFAEAGVHPVDTVLLPPAHDDGSRRPAFVLLHEHLDGFGLDLPDPPRWSTN